MRGGDEQITIGIDARAAAEVPAGRGRVVRELLRSLAAREDRNRYVLYAREAWRGAVLDDRFRWRLIGARDPWWHLLTARSATRECDVFFSSNSYLTVWFTRIPAVVLVHDMIAFDPAMRPNRRSTAIERLTLPLAVRRSKVLLCTTHATERALIDRVPAAEGRTAIAPLGVAVRSASELQDADREMLPPPGFVLAVGTLEPRKNLPRLVDAYRSLDERLQRRHQLVVVGALGWEAGETLDALRSLGDRCTTLGHVTDAALAELYRRCAVFCYPSLGEGFGLPVLEAMAAGAAVITSDLSSLPEVGGDAVQYVDPRQVPDLARALSALLDDPERRQQLAAAARARAALFTWQSTAEEVLGALRRAARAD